jgi:hypothetical protein
MPDRGCAMPEQSYRKGDRRYGEGGTQRLHQIVALQVERLDNLTCTHTRESGDRYCDARDCGGLVNPTWASSGVATAHHNLAALETYLSAEWSFQERRRESYDWRGITRRPSATQVNLRLGYRTDAGLRGSSTSRMSSMPNTCGASRTRAILHLGTSGGSQPRSHGTTLRWGSYREAAPSRLMPFTCLSLIRRTVAGLPVLCEK